MSDMLPGIFEGKTDAEIGASVREAASLFWQSEGNAGAALTGAQIFIQATICLGSDEATLRMGRVTVDGQPQGDWEVTARRTDL